MKGDNNMPTVLPKENEVEQFFSRIMASEGACERLSNVLYDHLSDDDMQTDPDPEHLVQVLLTAYTNGDISALLLELCGRSLFDLLREAYLIPKRFHGKAGKNPELLTTPEGDVIEEKKKLVTKHEFEKFLDVYKKADRIVFAEKNISATPINFTEEEILERFVRGDKSRTDGGSGLGLSISKSFTEACGGIFNIEIDGDMFKAIVEMPIIQEDTAEKTDDKTE